MKEFRNVLPLFLGTLVWMATLALAGFGPELLWGNDAVLSWIAVGANLVAGVAWIVVHGRYLRGVDDLQRKILMDAIAIALGVGLVVGFAAWAADGAGLIAVESEIAYLSVLMSVTYMLGVAGGTVRYR